MIWNVSILLKTSQLIHCDITIVNSSDHFLVTLVYGLNTPSERKLLWNDLTNLSSQISSKWCVLGDFNEILSLDETQGGNDIWTSGMTDFKQCLELSGLADIRAVGPHHTWWNFQGNHTITRNLDRALGNAAWFTEMNLSLTTFGARGISDHNTVILNSGIHFQKSFKPFQFFNHLLLLDGYHDVVRNAWSCQISGSPTYILDEKLKRTKKALINLNKQHCCVLTDVQKARQALHDAQTKIQASLSFIQEDSDNERRLSNKLWNAIMIEEQLLHQKSRIQWLNLGDKNTNFFNAKVKSRWNTNKILSLENSLGHPVTEQDQIKNIAVDFYKHLLGTLSSIPYPGFDHLSNIIDKHNSPDSTSTLIAPITPMEILSALKSMKRNKSPGPDGFNVNFFFHSWDIVGEDFIAAVQSFFSSGRMLKETNATAIALSPKAVTLLTIFLLLRSCSEIIIELQVL